MDIGGNHKGGEEQNQIKVIYESVSANETEIPSRLDKAFDLLFEQMFKKQNLTTMAAEMHNNVKITPWTESKR